MKKNWSDKRILEELKKAWNKRFSYWVKGTKLYTKGDKTGKLTAKGFLNIAKGNRLLTMGDIIWANTIVNLLGDVTVEWFNIHHCLLGSNKKYEFKVEEKDFNVEVKRVLH